MNKDIITSIALRVVVFVCGAVVMILELTASRIIAPYLGTSIIVWTSLIGIILGSLSFGYWWGGKIADKTANYKRLGIILATSAVLTALISYFKPVLSLIQKINSVEVGAILATLILFAPATVTLGMISPYAVRLAMRSVEGSGRTVGNLYAISTVGSIVGTFLGGFFLISIFGNTKIITILSLVLALCSLLVFLVENKNYEQPRLFFFSLFLLPFFFPTSGLLLSSDETLVADVDTRYNRMWIIDKIDPETKRPVRYITNTREVTQSGMFVDNPTELLSKYAEFFDYAEHFYPNFSSSLMIGAGAYSYPKHYLEKFPKATMDVVEIDSKLTALAQQYFALKESPRLSIFHEDGRTFLNKNTNKYDVVFMDAFLSYWAIPYQLTTEEAIQRIYNSLNDSGVVIVNMISGIEGLAGSFFRAEYATYAKIFPQVYVFQVDPPRASDKIQNIVFIATKYRDKPDFLNTKNNVISKNLWLKKIVLDISPLTDDFAPVEYLNLNTIF